MQSANKGSNRVGVEPMISGSGALPFATARAAGDSALLTEYSANDQPP